MVLKTDAGMVQMRARVSVVTLAERGESSIADISPKNDPSDISPRMTSLPTAIRMMMRTEPETIKRTSVLVSSISMTSSCSP